MDNNQLKNANIKQCKDLTLLIEEENNIRISSISLDINQLLEHNLLDEFHDVSNEIKEIVFSKLLEEKLHTYDENAEIDYIDEDGFGVVSDDPYRSYKVFVDDGEAYINSYDYLNKIGSYFYDECKSIYQNGYYEAIVQTNDWRYEYLGLLLKGHSSNKDDVIYEVSPISRDFRNIINLNENYNKDYFTIDEGVTLKIWNIDKKFIYTPLNSDFKPFITRLVHSILFEISRKHSVDIKMSSFDYDFDDIEEEVEGLESEFKVEICKLDKEYDTDLLNYYYEASLMDESEFQYIAYYRVIECIFDEVYRAQTLSDVKSIINSDGFSTYSNSDLGMIVELVEKYQKDKNDKEKIRLVFEKYLRGNLRDEAFLYSNKEIIDILIDDLKLIKKPNEFKDMQKIGNIIYDFRCQCTHSNRTYSKKTVNIKSDGLRNYIRLIKKVCQRIITTFEK